MYLCIRLWIRHDDWTTYSCMEWFAIKVIKETRFKALMVSYFKCVTRSPSIVIINTPGIVTVKQIDMLAG